MKCSPSGCIFDIQSPNQLFLLLYSDFIFTATLWGRRFCGSHFTDEETEAQRRGWPKPDVAELGSRPEPGRARPLPGAPCVERILKVEQEAVSRS